MKLNGSFRDVVGICKELEALGKEVPKLMCKRNQDRSDKKEHRADECTVHVGADDILATACRRIVFLSPG